MKTLILTLFVSAVFFSQLHAQFSGIGAQDRLNFWMESWELTWENSDGTKGTGTNHITKTAEDKVIQENFEGSNGLKGISISVYNPNTDVWHQAWADNQGSYFNFIGEYTDSTFIFKTLPKSTNSGILVQRMIFKEIKENSLTWSWEMSKDGGESWSVAWEIFYKRKL